MGAAAAAGKFFWFTFFNLLTLTYFTFFGEHLSEKPPCLCLCCAAASCCLLHSDLELCQFACHTPPLLETGNDMYDCQRFVSRPCWLCNDFGRVLGSESIYIGSLHMTHVQVHMLLCQIWSVDPQMRSMRLRWCGHVYRMLDSRLPKVMLCGQIKGSHPSGRPRKVWNDIASSDSQQFNIRCLYSDAQNKPAWRGRTCITHT